MVSMGEITRDGSGGGRGEAREAGRARGERERAEGRQGKARGGSGDGTRKG
jgi:hypothetical protein